MQGYLDSFKDLALYLKYMEKPLNVLNGRLLKLNLVFVCLLALLFKDQCSVQEKNSQKPF